MNSGKKIELDVRFEVAVLLGQILIPSPIFDTMRIHRDTGHRGEGTSINNDLE